MVVIGVTDEKLDVVDRWFKRKQPQYPIVVTSDREFEQALGVRFFPTGAVISPDGVIAYAGSAGGAHKPLEEAADASDKAPLFPKDLAKVRKELNEGQMEDAYKQLERVAGKRGLEEADAAWVERFRQYIEGMARSDFDGAKAYAERGLLHSAERLAEPLAEATALPISAEVAAWLDELAQRPDYKDAIKAGKHWDQAQELEDDREFEDAIKAYRVVIKRYDGTPIADLALKRVADIVESGMPGFHQHCNACRAADRACEKHHVKVKL